MSFVTYGIVLVKKYKITAEICKTFLFQKQRELVEQCLAFIIAQDKLRQDSIAVLSELEKLIELGNQTLTDPQAIPSSYSSVANEFNTPLSNAEDLLSSKGFEGEPVLGQLKTLVEYAKEVQANLLNRATAWIKFTAERDSATDQLEAIREPIDTVEAKPLRSTQEVTDDLDYLKVTNLQTADLFLSYFISILCFQKT